MKNGRNRLADLLGIEIMSNCYLAGLIKNIIR